MPGFTLRRMTLPLFDKGVKERAFVFPAERNPRWVSGKRYLLYAVNSFSLQLSKTFLNVILLSLKTLAVVEYFSMLHWEILQGQGPVIDQSTGVRRIPPALYFHALGEDNFTRIRSIILRTCQ